MANNDGSMFLSRDVMKPVYHSKCRYDSNDKNCTEKLFTRTKDTERFPVPTNKIQWNSIYYEYKPKNFTADKIYKKSEGDYKDPSEKDKNEFSSIQWNTEPKKSHHGSYQLQFNKELGVNVPLNPVGRTGIIGRGHLGKWGPNHAADPIVTRWKRDEKGKIEIHETSKLPILQFVAVQRRDTKEWAIPGGMVEKGEFFRQAMSREFAEEALSKEFEFVTQVVNHKLYSIVTGTEELNEGFNKFFLNGVEIYRGYVDDPRNTDNSWMETIAYNFHDEENKFVNKLELKGGSDATDAVWRDLDSSLKLFASHSEFLAEVASRLKSHW